MEMIAGAIVLFAPAYLAAHTAAMQLVPLLIMLILLSFGVGILSKGQVRLGELIAKKWRTFQASVPGHGFLILMGVIILGLEFYGAGARNAPGFELLVFSVVLPWLGGFIMGRFSLQLPVSLGTIAGALQGFLGGAYFLSRHMLDVAEPVSVIVAASTTILGGLLGLWGGIGGRAYARAIGK